MQVLLKGVLKEHLGREQVTLSIKESISLKELKSRLGIDPGIAVVACDGEKHIKTSVRFNNSDTITLMPVVAGG